MADDKTKKLSNYQSIKEKLEMERENEERMKKMEEEMQSLTDRELELLKRYKKKGKEQKDPKPKKDPVTGADYLYAKKGGMVRKSKVAGRLAKRGYGKAMKGKK